MAIEELNLKAVEFSPFADKTITRIMDAVDDADQDEAYDLMENATSDVVRRLAANRIIAIEMQSIVDSKKEVGDG